ncbi:MAG TPA: DUF6448 family protein [Vicinamibacterales bacterium]
MQNRTPTVIVAILAAAVLIAPRAAFAHCDSLDGPVVKAAERALDSADVAYVLVWVQADGEAEVRAAFAQALAVRALNAQARALADRYFFETVVRIHRAGEGAPFTGLQPAGAAGPVITMADRALTAGSVNTLAASLSAELSEGLHRHFEAAAEARAYDARDISAGRRYVKAYVEYLHFIERLHEAMQAAPHHSKH